MRIEYRRMKPKANVLCQCMPTLDRIHAPSLLFHCFESKKTAESGMFPIGIHYLRRSTIHISGSMHQIATAGQP